MRRNVLFVGVLLGVLGAGAGLLLQDSLVALAQDEGQPASRPVRIAGSTEPSYPVAAREEPLPNAFAEKKEPVADRLPEPTLLPREPVPFADDAPFLQSDRAVERGARELPSRLAEPQPGPLPNLLVLLDGDSLRVVSGARAAAMLNAAAKEPLPKNLLLVQCEEFYQPAAADVAHPLHFSGRVMVKALDFEATAAKLTRTDTRFLLEGEGAEPARLTRAGSNDEAFTLSAMRIEFDFTRNEIKAGAASAIQASPPQNADQAATKEAEASDRADVP